MKSASGSSLTLVSTRSPGRRSLPLAPGVGLFWRGHEESENRCPRTQRGTSNGRASPLQTLQRNATRVGFQTEILDRDIRRLVQGLLPPIAERTDRYAELPRHRSRWRGRQPRQDAVPPIPANDSLETVSSRRVETVSDAVRSLLLGLVAPSSPSHLRTSRVRTTGRRDRSLWSVSREVSRQTSHLNTKNGGLGSAPKESRVLVSPIPGGITEPWSKPGREPRGRGWARLEAAPMIFESDMVIRRRRIPEQAPNLRIPFSGAGLRVAGLRAFPETGASLFASAASIKSHPAFKKEAIRTGASRERE